MTNSYNNKDNCIHFCQTCFDALSKEKEARECYDYFCIIHACSGQAVVLTEPLDEDEKYCINLLETSGYLVSTELGIGGLAILPKVRECDYKILYCSRINCVTVGYGKHKD